VVVGRGTTAATSAPVLRVDLLGPLRLVVDGEVVAVPGPKRRALLAVLATAESRSVPVDDLLEALWPGELPESAHATLRSHISRLRRHLGPAAPLLQAAAGGYRLGRPGERPSTDVALARELLARSRRLEPPVALDVLRRARSLWRGPPLAEFVDVDRLRASGVGLDELWCSVDEALVTAAIDAGCTGEAVEVAGAMVARRPFSDPAAMLLVRALDAAGRSADALRAGYAHRRRLAEETGLEPSPALSELEAQIAGRTSGRAGRVPRPGTTLRGRDREVAALGALLAHQQLVTVVGPGGVGKTRLAVEVVGGADRATALWLAPVTDDAGVVRALASALDLRLLHGDPLAACTALLGAGPGVLLIDGAEHVLGAVRRVVTGLVDACPDLTVLVTSREALGLEAEHQLRLAPLLLVDLAGHDDLDRMPAVAVFVDRARRVRPGYSPTGGEMATIADIVRRLDGIPLAIELAAGRLSSLELGDLHARLDRCLDLLGDGVSTTLRQTLAWSYDLLPAPEQRLLRRLSLFRDGFDLATAELVATGAGVPGDTAASLAHLVDASMVGRSGTRYRMLDTMRTFALDRLVDAGEEKVATDQLVDWARQLATEIDRTVDSGGEPRADRLLRREFGNLRAAWEATRDPTRLDDAVHLVSCLADPAGWRDLPEVGDWTLELADRDAVASHPLAAHLLGLAADSAWNRGELDRADRLVGRALEGATEEAWSCRSARVLIALSRGDLMTAVHLGTSAAPGTMRIDQTLGVAALAAAYAGELDRARALSARLRTSARSVTLDAFSAYVDGEIDAVDGRSASAERHYERAIGCSRLSGATFLEGIASVGLLTLRSRTGSVDEALRGYRELIDYWELTGGWLQQWTTLRNLADLLRTLDDEDEDETAVFLEAAADYAPEAPAINDGRPDRHRSTLDANRFAEAHRQARTSERSTVVDVARRAIDRQLAGARHAPSHSLPPRRVRKD
jgi:predicted ATPase/DNA-binding SARP family transcriptional activator